MSVSERRNRRGRDRDPRAPRFDLIPDRFTPEGLAEVGRFGDYLGRLLAPMGGAISDTGYDLVDGWAEMLITTPAGPVIEVKMRIYNERASVIGDCMGCAATGVGVTLGFYNTRPVYLCEACYR